MINPMELFLLWFLSQDIIILVTLLPLVALTFFLGIISFAKRKGE